MTTRCSHSHKSQNSLASCKNSWISKKITNFDKPYVPVLWPFQNAVESRALCMYAIGSVCAHSLVKLFPGAVGDYSAAVDRAALRIRFHKAEKDSSRYS